MLSGTQRFIGNRGQHLDSTGEVARDVLYLADIPGGRMYIRRSGISLVSNEKKYAPPVNKDADKDKLRPYPALPGPTLGEVLFLDAISV